MARETLEHRVLKKALEVAGSERALARRLRLSTEDLLSFLAGIERPTRSVFLAACDLLIERGEVGFFDPPPAETGEEHEPKAASA